MLWRSPKVERQASAPQEENSMQPISHYMLAAVSFFAYGTCRNSLGPCAFDCGPNTPVTMNCVDGNLMPSMAMNGMVPPVPIDIASRSKKLRDAS